jgi:hypothetical protein
MLRKSRARAMRDIFVRVLRSFSADKDRREQLAYFLRVRLVERRNFLGALKGQQDLAANRVDCRSAIYTRRRAPPVTVTKVVVLNSGREHEEVVRHNVLFQVNQPLFCVDAADFIEQRLNIFLAVQDGPEQLGNFVGG